MELYIKKWWGNYIGGCDDSLLLLDYFGNQEQYNLELNFIRYPFECLIKRRLCEWRRRLFLHR